MASVSDGGGTAVTFALSANEALAIVSNGTSYTFSTNQTFTNGKVADAASDFSAFGGASLTLRAPGLNRYVLISIVDTGMNASVTFNNSGAGNYSDSFFVSLDNAAGPIAFNGKTTLADFASLSVSTTDNIKLVSGSSVTTTKGDLIISSAGNNNDVTVSGNIRSEGGNIELTATRHVEVVTGVTINSQSGSVKLGADLTTAGTGDDGSGTLTIQAGATVYGANITLRGADTDIASTATVGSAVVGNLALAATLTGLNTPWSLEVDGSDNLFVANQAGTTVSKFAPGATTASTQLIGLNQPQALAFDSKGNLYVTNPGGFATGFTVSRFAPGAITANATLSTNFGPGALAVGPGDVLYVANFSANTVTAFQANTTSPFLTITGLSRPRAVTLDPSGNLYVANYGSDTVSKFAPGATTPSATLTGLDNPWDLAFDDFGNLYVSNSGGASVSKFAPGATTPSATLTGGLFGPEGLAFDAGGNLFVANENGYTVSIFAPGATTSSATLTGLDGPRDLVFDRSGNLFVSNYHFGGGGTTVSKFAPAFGATSTVNIQSSLESRPMSLGGTNTAVAGINLTDAELARIFTTATGTVSIGSSSQTGHITLTTATLASTAGAATIVTQSTAGGGRINLDDGAGTAPAIQGNGGSITLTAGSGGITALAPSNNAAEIATSGPSVTLNTPGPLGTSANRIQLADANLAQQIVFIGATKPPSSVYLDGLGSLTLGGIAGGNANTTIDVTARGNLVVVTGATLNSGGLSVSLGADLTAAGAGDDGNGTLTIQGGASVYGAAITLRGADVDIASAATVGSSVTGNLLAATLSAGSTPGALAFDGSGNLYVIVVDDDTVAKFAPGATTPSARLSGFSNPWDLAVDSGSNLFVSDFFSQTVSKFAPGGTTPSAKLSGFFSPTALAFDRSGNLFVADYYGNAVIKFAPGATMPSATLSGVEFPQALAFDSNDNLFVANESGTVSKFAPRATTPSATLTGLSFPAALAFDSAGNLFVANRNGNTVSKFAPGATTPSATLTGGLNRPGALALDSSDNLYVANISGNTVSVFAPGATTPSATLTGLNGPDALAFDSSGNLFVSASGSVRKLALAVAATSTIVIQSSLASRPMSLGGTNTAVAGINLTDAELARIFTTPTGTVTIGSGNQAGNITLTTATVANTAEAYTFVTQATAEKGRIILDDGTGAGPAIQGNGGSISLTAGTGGITALAPNNTVAEIATSGKRVTLNTSGAIGTSANRIQLADDANSSQQDVFIGATQPPSSVYLDGLGGLTLGDISGGVVNTTIDVTARGNLVVATGTTLNSGTAAVSLGADLTAAGAGDDGNGTLTIEAGAKIYGADITLRGADVSIAGSATVGSVATTLSGLNHPVALTFDSSGNLFVANQTNNTVSRFAPGAITPSATLTGLSQPQALAFDGSGNLYVANANGNTVSKFAPGAITASATLNGLNGPGALAFDSSGNLYVANLNASTVSKFAPGATTPSATLTGLIFPEALAFDSSGNLYVANSLGTTVSKFAPGATTAGDSLNGLNGPVALAFDSTGNLYVANYSGNTVSKFAPGATTPSATLTGLNGPDALALDSSGNLYVANSNGNTVSKFAAGATTPSATFTGFDFPRALALGSNSTLYVANYGDGTVSKFSLTIPTTLTVHLGTSVDTRPIDLGANSAGSLGLTGAELDRIVARALQIAAGKGAIAVSANITRSAATDVTLASDKAIQFTTGSLNTAGGNLTLVPGNTASLGVARQGNDVTVGASGTLGFASGSDLNIALNGTAVDTQYDQLNIVGRVNLTGVDLAPLIGFSPAVGSVFVIVNNDGSADPVVGTFNGLPEGKVFSVVKGTFSATFQISYQGGDGNDVVLTALSASNAEVQGTPGADAFVVKLNGDNIEVSLNGTVILSTPLSPVTTLTIDGLGGGGVLTIDSSGGDPFPSGGITFEGAGSLSLGNGSNLAVPINGTTPGQPGGYNQLTVSGNVDLAGTNLVLLGTYTPAVGDQFTIVSNSLAAGQTTGNFAGLPEGTVFTPAAGPINAAFAISYHGGDGNDVVLTVVNGPPSFQKGADQAVTDESPAQSIPGWATGVSAGPPNEAGQNLTFQVTVPVAQQPWFAVLPQVDATGTLAFTPAPNAFGSVQVSVTLLDDGGTANGGSDASTPQTFNITIAKPHRWHNLSKPFDVRGGSTVTPDDFVDAGDALAIINYINAFDSSQVPGDAQVGLPFGFLDTNKDDHVAPDDALSIINAINAGTEGEAESSENQDESFNSAVALQPSMPRGDLAPDDLIGLLAFDLAAVPKRRR